jgi:cystathionine beta-lyase
MVRYRRGTKWQRTPGAIAAWVADMDVAPAGIIRQHLFELVGRGDLGYPHWPGGHGSPGRAAFANWCAQRYGWVLSDTDELVEFCDVVQAIQVFLYLCTRPGDGVLLHTPAYPPMFAAIESAGCELMEIPLVASCGTSTGMGWDGDLEHLEQILLGPTGERIKVLLLCHPHNPTGKVFSREELQRLGDLAQRHDLVIISDEIHGDLEHSREQHLPMAAVSPEIAQRTVTIHSASKAFNLAGLRYAVAHVGPIWIRERLATMPSHLFGAPNLAGVTAAVAAWTEPEAVVWLEQVRGHFAEQRHLLAELLAQHLPEVIYHVPEATYLAWLDVRSLGLGDDPSEFWRSPDRGVDRVDLSPGPDFGRPGYVRLNFATSAGILTEMVNAMERGFRTALRK